MPTPRSPRGRKAKGDLGERQAKAILQGWGLTVLDGRMTEPGVDLILNPEAVVEVKNHSWSALGGIARQDLFKAAELHRRKGVAHWCLFHEPEGWLLARIGLNPKTFRVGLVYRLWVDSVHAQSTPLPPGFPKALAPTTSFSKTPEETP